jgi:predicted phosphoadenosine phosphosulfate sulfurtransferase
MDSALPILLFAASVVISCKRTNNVHTTPPMTQQLGKKLLPSSQKRVTSVVPNADSLSFYYALRNCKDEYISHHINSALDILSDALRLYGSRLLLTSYNGGKDADVVMHLLRAVAAKVQEDTKEICDPELIYFAIEDEFPEITAHISAQQLRYNLNITQYNCSIGQVNDYTQ